MIRLRDLPIRRKLLWMGVITSAISLVVMSAAWLVFSYFIVRYNMRMGLAVQAAIVTENVSAAVQFRDSKVAQDTLTALRNTPIVDLACVYDTGSRVLARYVRSGVDADCPASPPSPGLDRADLRRIVLARAIEFNEKTAGVLYLQGNYVRLAEQLRLQTWAALGGLLVGVIAAFVIASRLRGTIATPILALAETSARIAKVGDYSLRAPHSGNDELGELADSFNAMVAGIERRDDQLRAASRLKDEFLATLSHELRTPLNAVSGWLQILRMQPADPDVMERALSSMERSTKSQVRLIEDMLDVSRIITGKLQLKTEVVDLVTIVDSAIDVTGTTASAKNVRLQRELLPPPRFVTGDADRLQQVMWNLLSNAVKFTPSGGVVKVTMTEEPGNYVVRVKDTGAGLDPDFLPHIFDRFRQADGSTSRHHGGLGLGLAIVHDLVGMHGGRVEAASEGLNTGSTFTVVLPQMLTSADVVRAPVPRARRADLDGLLVLAVDDNTESLDVVGEALSRAGARVELATDAERALSALAARRFDVLVCDLAMPEIDGFDLLRRVRTEQDAQGRFLPAVAVSAHAGAEDQTRAQVVGFQEFVTKPYAFDTLVHAVAKAAGRSA